jgi:VanZ family protein
MYKTSYKYLFLVWWIITTTLFLLPPDYFPIPENYFKLIAFDKIIHIIVFIVFSFLIYKISYKTYISIIMSFIFVLSYAIIIEYLQQYTCRNFDVYDYIASIIGVLITYSLIFFYKIIKLIVYKFNNIN